ncbi:anaphase-promoting complex subunit 10 isoform X1 [Numida meleagris]|uniref:anaphase-promoting complex subunit 10 isoform X1 n=1 Tax=Numida meleagris TaxID=8996 RepID=UPI000B3D8B41|nr:anaphase-promoting complex subunit 10 isoform X1 [Numida meleagris]XP_021251141.1 anaphase-promoting complex subunit 10 isoform X1 [Numida meleagris]
MTTPNKTPPGADPKQLERTGTVREIGSQAVWSLSSCKPGFGVDQLRDDNLETYWQSDGSQPHLVNIQFRRKTTVKTLCIYADYKSDESYTPSKISVRVGNNFHNLQEIRNQDLMFLSGLNYGDDFEDSGENPVILLSLLAGVDLLLFVRQYSYLLLNSAYFVVRFSHPFGFDSCFLTSCSRPIASRAISVV